jgi:hypothetical protein
LEWHSPLLMTCSVFFSDYSCMFPYVPMSPILCVESEVLSPPRHPKTSYLPHFSVEQLRPKFLEGCRAAANPGTNLPHGAGWVGHFISCFDNVNNVMTMLYILCSTCLSDLSGNKIQPQHSLAQFCPFSFMYFTSQVDLQLASALLAITS